MENKEKTCTKCKLVKSLDCFSKDLSSKSGLKSSCKECNKKLSKIYFENNRDQINTKKRERRKDPEVKQKEKEKYKEYYHRPEIKQKYQKYRNTQEVKDRMETYRNDPINQEKAKNNYEKNKPKRLEIFKEKYSKDEDFRIKIIIRSRIQKALKRNKTNSSFEYLGCDVDFLKKWLEYRFDGNMNWNNLGVYWHIDHILPVNLFDCTNDDEQYICFHWTNLQPLESNENLLKRDKLKLHYYYNNIVNVNRFNAKYKQFIGYQAIRESLLWLKKKDFRYGNNSSDDSVKITLEMDNPQPSSYVHYDKDMEKAQRLNDSGLERSNQPL